MHGREWHVILKVFCGGMMIGGIIFWLLAFFIKFEIAWSLGIIGTLCLICGFLGLIASFQQTQKSANRYFVSLLFSTVLISFFIGLNVILDLVFANQLCYESSIDCGVFLAYIGIGGAVLAITSMIGCCGCAYFASKFYKEIKEEDRFLSPEEEEEEEEVKKELIDNDTIQ